MNIAKKVFVFSMILTLSVGCARLGLKKDTDTGSPDIVMETQKHNLEQINQTLAHLSERIADAKQSQAPEDPILKEIRATDLATMQLRQKQLRLLRKHCYFAKDILVESRTNPGKKQQILGKWDQHKKQLFDELDEIVKQEDKLLMKRLQLEMDLVRKSLQ